MWWVETIYCQMRFQLVNNWSGCRRQQYIQLEEIRVAVSCNQVTGALELELVCWDTRAWSYRYLATYRRFFLLLCFVAVTNAAPWNELCDFLVDVWPVEGFFGSPGVPLNRWLACTLSIMHCLRPDPDGTTLYSPLLLTGDMNSINWPRSQCVAS